METPQRDALARLWKEIAQAPVEPAGVPETIGRYRIQRRLGDGGSASVFLAEDTSLHRPVALKLLKLSDAGSIARFRREALTAAALDHPNVVKVFDAGEANGQAYIAMQFIAGEPISSRKLSVPEALRAVQKVAEGLHVAHSKGILHRDVKPGNIMVDERGECFLTDFGLARETQERGVSVSGTILGTPAYMSPEQARGVHRELDARSDVYSLGATLYELVTGRPPHRGQTAFELLQSAVAGDWLRPRKLNPGLPRDVEVILVRAMALEKDRRYQSARELAEDIGRHLAGEPIVARPAGLGYRLLRFARRQRMALGLAAAALVAAGLAAAVLVPALRSEQKRAEDAEAQALAMLRRVANGATDAILAARRKGEVVRFAQETMRRGLKEAYEQAQRRAPNLAEPDYLMGRVERALMRDAEAEAYQERALAKDPAYGPALYEMAVLLSRRYAREFARADLKLRSRWTAAAGRIEASDLKELKEPSREEVERAQPGLAELRDRVEALCRRLEGAIASSGLREAIVLSAQGISAAKLGRTEEARALLTRAVGQDASLEEAFETLAEIAPEPGEKERWYTEGLKHDAGYPGHLIGRGSIRSQHALFLLEQEGGPEGACRLADEDFGRALALDPDSVRALQGRASVRMTLAAYRSTRGEDALVDLRQAVDDLTRALELDQGSADALIKRGGARANQGVFKSNRGQDPTEEYRLAEADFDEALKIDPDHPRAWNWRASLHAYRATYKKGRGEDAMEDFRRAESDFQRVLELEQKRAGGWAERGYLRLARGDYRMGRSEDPSEDFRLAEEDLNHAVTLSPDSPMHWTMLGDVHQSRANYRTNRSGDSAQAYAAAEDCYSRALKVNPEFARAWGKRAILRSNRAQQQTVGGEDPTREFERSEEDFARALKLDPKDADTWSARGRMCANFAYWRYRQTLDPTVECEGMEKHFAAALEIKQDLAVAWQGRGFGRTVTGLFQASRRLDPLPEWARAEEDLREAVTRDSDNAWSWLCRGELRYNRALYLELAGDRAEAGRQFATAVADFERAIRLKASYGRLIQGRLDDARRKASSEY